jgi:CO/xanthine dehydrogenase Mo-binding subunit
MRRAMPAGTVRDKLAGRARYTRDLIDRISGGVMVGIVRSPHAHARVVAVDASRALALPGVLGVLTGADFEGITLGSEIPDEPVLAADRARYVGDHVAAVAAESADALRRALAAVEVTYEPLPAAFTPEAALQLGAPIHPGRPDNVATSIRADRGDWNAAVRQVAVWAEGEFEVKPVHHAYMEPHAALARYESGVITLFAATHSPTRIREEYRPWIERGQERFEIRTPDVGGAFGAKYEHPIHLICAEFARRLRRDVGIALSRREDFIAARPRVPMRLRVRIGADSSGRLVAKETDVLANNGASSLHGPSVLMAAATRMDNLYRYQAIRCQGRLVYTNLPPTECYRGFGDPESAFAQEQLIDELARGLAVDRFEIRRRNAVGDGDTTIHGWRVSSSGFSQCLDAIQRGIAVDSAASGPDIEDESLRFRIGYGMAPTMHVTSNRGRVARDFATVDLKVSSDGTVMLLSSEVDVGTGAGRVLGNIVADIVRVRGNQVRAVLGDTELGPDGLGSYGSRTTFFAGNAAIQAGHTLRKRIDDLSSDLGLESLPELAAELGRRGRLDELDVRGEYTAEDVESPDESGYGNRSPAYTFGVHGCKIRTDTWTGAVTVLRYWAAHDAGTVLDQPGARGQVIGGILQGLGHSLSEESLVGSRGEVGNPGFLDYRIPTCLDSVPVEVTFSETYDPGGPLGAKSLAEPPIIPVAACVANAIRDATGARLDVLPMTPERVLDALTAAPGGSTQRLVRAAAQKG